MGKTCDNNYAPVMHGTKEFCLENVYDKALDDGPILVDDINSTTTTKNDIGGVLTLSWNPIPLENDQSSCYKLLKLGLKVLIPLFLSLIKIMCL